MRRLLVLVGSIVFVDALLFGALTPLIPGYAEDFQLSKAGAGLLAGAFGAGALAGGIPAGLLSLRVGPRLTVLAGLGLLAAASFAFALAGDPWALGAARFVQGLASTTTWTGALAWLTVAAPAGRRGEVLGTAFAVAVLGAILGPVFGGAADAVSIRASFGVVGVLAIAFAVWTALHPPAPVEQQEPHALRRALRDVRFVGGLWLNTLPAFLFGTLSLLVPLALADGGWAPLAIGAAFLAAGLVEAAFNPLLGRISDRVGRFLPTRLALAASVVVSVALAVASAPAALVALLCLAAVTFGGFYTPGMALVSDRAHVAGLSQGLAFGVMGSAWAAGNLAGPALGGALAERLGDAVPYLAGGALCLLTLVAAQGVAGGRHVGAAA